MKAGKLLIVGLVRVAIAMALATVVAACGSTSTTTTAVGPTPTKCEVSVGAASSTIDAAGGHGSVVLTTQPECTWTAATESKWISGLSPSSGQGSGSVAFDVAANPDGISRQATVTVNGRQAVFNQEAAACTITLAASSVDVSDAGGTATVAVTSPNGCSWATSSGAPWISVTAGATGTGPGTVTIRAASNTGIARTGSVDVGGQMLTVSQAAAPIAPPIIPSCNFSIQPTTVSMPIAGGTGTAAVTATAGCAWDATSVSPWITITSGASGQGRGNVTFSVAPNTGSARIAELSIAGKVLSISQAGSCALSITPTTQSAGATAGTGTPIAVTTAVGCTWTATSSVPWLTIVSGATGSGPGSVTFSIAANTDAARAGSILIGNQAFTVTQAAPACSFLIAPTSQPVTAAGDTGMPIGVTTIAGCAWTATNNVPWITVTAGASGTGSGSVSFSVATNTGAARTGTLTIAGQTFTVTQAAAATCSFSIGATNQSVGAAGGAVGSVSVTTTAGCGWTATNNVPWITVTAGTSATGSGSVSFSVAANTGAARTGTLTIAGQTLTVTQAVACSYSVSPTSQSAPAGGGAGTSITVTTVSGCAWTAASNTSWITVTSGASSSGNGTASYSVSANVGPARTGTLTVAGQTFTVTQAANCTYSISPSSLDATSAGGGGSSTVTATAGCAWTAASNASWVTVSSGASGSGNGTVAFVVAANPSASKRNGTLTIAGQTFSVSQDKDKK